MEPLIVGMVLLSAALHPIRDSILRSDAKPSTAYLAIVLFVLLFSGTHVALGQKDLLSAMKVLPLIAVAVTSMSIYSLSLILTFSRGELSIYYPITRSSPIFIVVVGVLFLGQTYDWGTLVGIVLVIVGGFLLQRKPGRRLVYEPTTLAFALLALAGHGTGAIVDGYAVQIIDPAVWFFWNWLLLVPVLLLLFRFVAADQFVWPPFVHWRGAWRRYLLVGGTLYASYYLMLLVYNMGGNVAAATAVRQASIPFAVLIGGIMLAEEAMRRRLLFSLVIAVGIALIVLSG